MRGIKYVVILGMQHWFFRFRLYHIPFWFAYHLLWLTINIGDLREVYHYLFLSGISTKFYFYVFFQAAAVYLNLYYLIPKFLYPGKYKTYIALLTGTILICTACIVSGYYISAYFSEMTFQEIYNRAPDQFFHFFAVNALPSTMASMTLAMSIKLAKNWLGAEKKRLLLEKENLESELKYLKSQINPHFLFNTINSIYFLIHKNPDLASEALASFSDMLRYQLYECNEGKIQLSKELGFLEDFIELERLRLFENQTDLKFEISNTTNQDPAIASFILLPFVENAFKHVSKDAGQQNFIKMNLSVDKEKHLQMQIVNSRMPEVLNTASGIGLSNVKRRLSLLYPNKHHLQIESNPEDFHVALSLDLS
ncbi:MAG: histidine kinase [Saprospiraceae bacterium]|nr:histidine kinase [Saprospiraceae bacterium]